MTITIPDNIPLAALSAALATLGLRLDAKRLPNGTHAALPVAAPATHPCCGKCQQQDAA